MSAIFSTYVTPQIKDINHTEFLQQWKLNFDAAEHEKNMKANMYKPSFKKKFNCVDNHKHRPASIKNEMQWFPFITIMERTENKIQEDKVLISSSLKMFSIL